MKKESIIFIIVVLLGIFVTLYFMNNNTNNTNNNGTTTKDNKPSADACLVDYKCLTIDNKEYYFSIKKEALVSNVYDYDTDSNINGKLYINDSKKLVFLNDKDNPIKEYTFDGDALINEWFPKLQRLDIFISHSHDDENLAKALAEWFDGKP